MEVPSSRDPFMKKGRITAIKTTVDEEDHIDYVSV